MTKSYKNGVFFFQILYSSSMMLSSTSAFLTSSSRGASFSVLLMPIIQRDWPKSTCPTADLTPRHNLLCQTRPIVYKSNTERLNRVGEGPETDTSLQQVGRKFSTRRTWGSNLPAEDGGKLERLNLGSYFSRLFSSSILTRSRYAKSIYLHAQKLLASLLQPKIRHKRSLTCETGKNWKKIPA